MIVTRMSADQHSRRYEGPEDQQSMRLTQTSLISNYRVVRQFCHTKWSLIFIVDCHFSKRSVTNLDSNESLSCTVSRLLPGSPTRCCRLSFVLSWLICCRQSSAIIRAAILVPGDSDFQGRARAPHEGT